MQLNRGESGDGVVFLAAAESTPERDEEKRRTHTCTHTHKEEGGERRWASPRCDFQEREWRVPPPPNCS